MNGTLGRLG
uniref:Uncharacterized protein n=1 Tax=Arundo donax TaxID=35708 RepID=A0A0A9SPC8_ARUDO